MVFVIDKQFVLCKVGNRFLNINFRKLHLKIACVYNEIYTLCYVNETIFFSSFKSG